MRPLAGLMLCGCMMMTGVMSVDIRLWPVSIATWPPDVDPTEYMSLPLTEGFVSADVMAETGRIDVGPLPLPPDGYVYVAILEVVDEPRESLPGGEAGDISWPSVPLLPTIGPPRDGRHGAIGGNWWTGKFTAGDLGVTVAGIRAASIVLRGIDAERVLLVGSVADQAAMGPSLTPQGGGLHVH